MDVEEVDIRSAKLLQRRFDRNLEGFIAISDIENLLSDAIISTLEVGCELTIGNPMSKRVRLGSGIRYLPL